MSRNQSSAGSRLTIGSSDPRIIYHNRTMAGGVRVQVWDKGLLWDGHGPTATYASTTDNRGWAEFRFPEPAVGFEYWGLQHDFAGTYNICLSPCMSNALPVVDAQGPVGPPALLYSANFNSPQTLIMSLTNRDSPQMDIVSLVLILPDSVTAAPRSVTPTPLTTSAPISIGITNTFTQTSTTDTSILPIFSSVPTSPTAPSTQTPQPSTSSSRLSSAFLGAIIGAALGATFICCIVFFLFYRYYLARRRRQSSPAMTPFSSGGAGTGGSSAPHMSQHQSISPFASPSTSSPLPSKIRLDTSRTGSNSSMHSTSPLRFKSSTPQTMTSNGAASLLPSPSNLNASPTQHNPSSNSSSFIPQNPSLHSHPTTDTDDASTVLDSQIHGPKSVNSLFPFIPPPRRDIDAGSLSLDLRSRVNGAVLLPPAYQPAWGDRNRSTNGSANG